MKQKKSLTLLSSILISLSFTSPSFSKEPVKNTKASKPVVIKKLEPKKITPVKVEENKGIDIKEIYTSPKPDNKKEIEPKKVEPKTEVKVEIPKVEEKKEVNPQDATSKPKETVTEKKEDKNLGVADDVDVLAYTYINNLEIRLALFELVTNSPCSKSPQNCNSDENLAKDAKRITGILKDKFPTTFSIISEAQVQYFLMNSVTIRDKFGDKNLQKINQLKEELAKLNEGIFKEKKQDIIKISQETSKKIEPSTNTPTATSSPVPQNPSTEPNNNTSTTTPSTTSTTNTDTTTTPVTTEPQSTNQNAFGKIAFVSERDGNPEIYVMNADGNNQKRLTTNDIYDLMPSFSPDGTKIAFVSERDGNPEIYVMNADGTNPVRLTNTTSYEYSPAWSPDGTKIIFVSNREVDKPVEGQSSILKITYKIFTMNVDGTEQQKISENSIDDESPRYSPDGSKIVFVSKRDGNAEIYSMKADGTEIKRLTNNANYDIMPAWSPDGKTIVFRTEIKGNPEIYVMNEDGSNPIKLTTNLVAGESPFYSFDGNKIVFVSKRDNVLSEDGIQTNEIYIMNFNGTNINRLTNNFFDDYSPFWGK